MELIKANLNNRNKRFVWIFLALQTDMICLAGGDVRIQCWFLNLFRDTHECELSFDIVMEILLLFSSTNLMRLHCVVQQDIFIHSLLLLSLLYTCGHDVLVRFILYGNLFISFFFQKNIHNFPYLRLPMTWKIAQWRIAAAFSERKNLSPSFLHLLLTNLFD